MTVERESAETLPSGPSEATPVLSTGCHRASLPSGAFAASGSWLAGPVNEGLFGCPQQGFLEVSPAAPEPPDK